MSKLKTWLFNRFLPAWCKEELLETNKRLLAANAELKHENERLNAYIDGMELAIRARSKITIRNEVPK